jgi:hypothetical protein
VHTAYEEQCAILCDEGRWQDTSENVLKTIMCWASDNTAPSVFQLTGTDRVVRSAIVHSASHRLSLVKYRVAKFLFSQDEEERRTASRVIPTIAWQLIFDNPVLREDIAVAVLTAGNTLELAAVDQAHILLCKPHDVQKGKTLIVLDALNECSGGVELMSGLHLASSRQKLSYKFLLSSDRNFDLPSGFGFKLNIDFISGSRIRAIQEPLDGRSCPMHLFHHYGHTFAKQFLFVTTSLLSAGNHIPILDVSRRSAFVEWPKYLMKSHPHSHPELLRLLSELCTKQVDSWALALEGAGPDYIEQGIHNIEAARTWAKVHLMFKCISGSKLLIRFLSLHLRPKSIVLCLVVQL